MEINIRIHISTSTRNYSHVHTYMLIHLTLYTNIPNEYSVKIATVFKIDFEDWPKDKIESRVLERKTVCMYLPNFIP